MSDEAANGFNYDEPCGWPVDGCHLAHLHLSRLNIEAVLEVLWRRVEQSFIEDQGVDPWDDQSQERTGLQLAIVLLEKALK